MKKKYMVTFHMKSGTKIEFTCDEITYVPAGDGSIKSYKVDNVRQGALFYADPKEIEAITYFAKRRFWS